MTHGKIRNAGDHRNSISVPQTTNRVRGVSRWGGGCQAAAPTTHKFKLKKKKKTDFVDIMISNVLCDLPSR